ncbi:MAG: hypothetical protein ABIA04_00630 [Pseudomonadota bacterium]
MLLLYIKSTGYKMVKNSAIAFKLRLARKMLIITVALLALTILLFSGCLQGENGQPNSGTSGNVNDSEGIEEDSITTEDDLGIVDSADVTEAIEDAIDSITSPVNLPVPSEIDEVDYAFTISANLPVTDIESSAKLSDFSLISRNDIISRNDNNPGNSSYLSKSKKLKYSTLASPAIACVKIEQDRVSGELTTKAYIAEEDGTVVIFWEDFPDEVNTTFSIYVKDETYGWIHFEDIVTESDLDEVYHSIDFSSYSSSIDLGSLAIENSKLISSSSLNLTSSPDPVGGLSSVSEFYAYGHITQRIGTDDSNTLYAITTDGSDVTTWLFNQSQFLDDGYTNNGNSANLIITPSDLAIEGSFKQTIVVSDEDYTSFYATFFNTHLIDSTLDINTSSPVSYMPPDAIHYEADDFLRGKLLAFGDSRNKIFSAGASKSITGGHGDYAVWHSFTSSGILVSPEVYHDNVEAIAQGIYYGGTTDADTDGTNFVIANKGAGGKKIVARLINSSYSITTTKIFEASSSISDPRVAVNNYGHGIIVFKADGDLYYSIIDTNEASISDAILFDLASFNCTSDGFIDVVVLNSDKVIIKNGYNAQSKVCLIASDYSEEGLDFTDSWTKNPSVASNYSKLGSIYDKDMLALIHGWQPGYGEALKITKYNKDGLSDNENGITIITSDSSTVRAPKLTSISVSGDAQGRILASWIAQVPNESTAYVYAVVFTANGDVINSDDDKFLVNSGVLNYLENVSGAMLDNGKFVITYTLAGSTSNYLYNLSL